MVPTGRVFAGTAISGPLEEVPDISLSLASQIQVRWIALQRMPADALAPIDSQARLTLAPDSDTALPASGQLTRPVRFATADEATAFAQHLAAGQLGAFAEIATDSRLVVPGATVQFAIFPAGASAASEPPVSLLVSPGADGTASTRPIEAVVGVAITRPANDGERRASGRTLRETAVVDAVPFADGSQFVAAAPLNSPGTPWTAIAAVATVNSASPDPAGIADLQTNLEQASEQVRAGLELPPLGHGPTLHSAMAAMRHPESARPALLLLTSLTDARIAGDVVLVADNEQLARIADEVQDYIDPDALPPLADLRWFLDRSAVQTLCEAAEKETLSPELQSVLALHAGDVARRPDAILELLKQVGNSDALADRLIAENIIALEDSSPAARARAYDWLAARDRAPADFDPFADARSRRAAIDKAMNQQGDQP